MKTMKTINIKSRRILLFLLENTFDPAVHLSISSQSRLHYKHRIQHTCPVRFAIGWFKELPLDPRCCQGVAGTLFAKPFYIKALESLADLKSSRCLSSKFIPMALRYKYTCSSESHHTEVGGQASPRFSYRASYSNTSSSVNMSEMIPTQRLRVDSYIAQDFALMSILLYVVISLPVNSSAYLPGPVSIGRSM
ncbi:hypothetical protein F5Y16DRAFT_365062 [Xylariaceae sp. FL0255]|nr:hypothetical protein F5Y16DRAFT_365062 [Xylariaceae sp. FL0255]